jgi:hypothetical protein
MNPLIFVVYIYLLMTVINIYIFILLHVKFQELVKQFFAVIIVLPKTLKNTSKLIGFVNYNFIFFFKSAIFFCFEIYQIFSFKYSIENLEILKLNKIDDITI